jgi:epsilon-lactone hydrolase
MAVNNTLARALGVSREQLRIVSGKESRRKTSVASTSVRSRNGSTDLRNPLVSPLYGDYRGIPPLLIQVGEAEIILDDSTRVAERAKHSGVRVDLEVWDEMVHVWHVFAKLLPEARQAIEKMGSYVIAHTS